MAYYRFTRLQQYINGQPTDTYTKGERVDNVDYSTYETCMGGSGNSRWVSIPQTVCYNGDLWSMEKEQISYDGGVTWIDTTNTRRVAVVEPSASQCSGADNDWRVVYGEYICNGTTKCLKEAEYINNSPTGRTRAGSIVELLSEYCGVMYQWVNVPGEYVCVFKCGRGDKYTKQKQQYSLDNGVHWEDTGETREGDFVEKNSSYCGCDTSVTRWVTVSGEYVCVGTSKYTKEKEQSSTDGTNWTDTGNTRAGSLIEASSSSCASTRWVTVSGQYSCVGTDKYNLEKEQTSTDGTNWTDTGNTRAGSTLIEANSTDCGYTPPSTTRWVADTGYVCVGTDKYNKEKEQISYDSGNTWSDTGATKAGSTLIEHDSEDCDTPLSEMTEKISSIRMYASRDADRSTFMYSVERPNYIYAQSSYGTVDSFTGNIVLDNTILGDRIYSIVDDGSHRLGIYEETLAYLENDNAGDSILGFSHTKGAAFSISTNEVGILYNKTLFQFVERNLNTVVSRSAVTNLNDLIPGISTSTYAGSLCFPRQREVYFIYYYNDTIIRLNMDTKVFDVYYTGSSTTISGQGSIHNWILYTNKTLRPLVSDGNVYIVDYNAKTYFNPGTDTWPYEYYYRQSDNRMLINNNPFLTQ